MRITKKIIKEIVKMERFPYTVNEEYAKLNDSRCCDTYMPDGWHSERCSKKIKEVIDGIGFCGVHARAIKKWRTK